MPSNIKALLNPVPRSGTTTPHQPPDLPGESIQSDENDPESSSDAVVAGRTTEKLAGLSLATNKQTTPETANRPTSSSSRSPAESRQTIQSSPTGALPLFPYSAPRTSISHEAPALQSFVPVQISKNVRTASSGSLADSANGGSSISPPPSANVVVKKEEDDASPIMPAFGERQASVSGRKKSESAAPAQRRPPKKPARKKGTAKKAGAVGGAAAKKTKPSEAKKAGAGKKAKKSDDENEVQDEGEELESGDGEEMDEDEEDEVYCICRKPDDHKYMIGCDGGCGDWFHGACVKITEEQGRVIDRYICDKCSSASGNVLFTTWRPICRYPGCGHPARVEGGGTNVKSLYCSEDHGRLFFSALVKEQGKRVGHQKPGAPSVSSKVRKSKTGAAAEGVSAGPSRYLRGGALPPQVLKALLSGISTAAEFHSLGDSLPAPAALQSSDLMDLDPLNPIPGLSSDDLVELASLTATRNTYLARKTAAQNRSKLLSHAVNRRDRTLTKLGLKRSGWCGYDASLVLPPEELAAKVAGLKEEGDEAPESVCTRKNCTVHGKWADTERQDCWSEIRMWSMKLDELERRVEEIGECAGRRGRMS